MNTLLDPLAPVLHAVLANAAKASLLACAVALTCLLLRRWLSPGWRHVLWCAVFLRLMLPDLAVPGWRWNVSRVIPDTAGVTAVVTGAPSLSSETGTLPAMEPMALAAKPEPPTVTQSSAPAAELMPRGVEREAVSLWHVLGGIWLAGALVWWAALCAGWWRFRRRVLGNATQATAQSRALLDACMAEAGVRARVELWCSAHITTPAVCGVVRHRILLPDSLESAIPTDELRLLLLHELGHVKRHDSTVQLLASILLGMHWWNPFLWLAWRQLRHEAEAATDAWVLQRTGANSASSYGGMLLALASRACATGLALALVPSLINATSSGRRLKRRILDIAAHRFAGRWAVAPGLAVLVCLVMAGFAQEAAKKSPETKTAPVTTAGEGTIGGIVVDEKGEPVAGAKVAIEIKTVPIRFVKSVLPPGYETPPPVDTDAEGRWQLSGVPAGVVPVSTQRGADTFYLHITHPDFLYQSFGGDSDSGEAPFRQGTSKLKLKRGLVMRGVVRDEAGNPIRGATVQRNLTTTPHGDPAVTADAAGRYEMKSARSGDRVVRISARGFATQLQRVKMSADTTQEFTLKKARTLTLKIRDHSGQPVDGVSVVIFPPDDGWKAADRLWWADEVPADGAVVWDGAPEGALVAEIKAPGFATLTHKVTAESDLIIKFPAENRLPRITINVTDADSGAPLTGCTFDTATTMLTSTSFNPFWVLPSSTTNRSVPMVPGSGDGEYRGAIPESARNYAIGFGVRREGYVPQLTGRIDPTQGDATLAVALRKGSPLELTVSDHHDAAMAGATVYVSWGAMLHLSEGALPSGSLSAQQLDFIGATGTDGRCVIPPCAPEAAVLVMHESGFAVSNVADLMRSPQMKLGLYAQVEARVTRDGKPAPGVKYQFSGSMELPGSGTLGALQSFSATSDEQGRIFLPRVLPTRIGNFREPSSRLRENEIRTFKPAESKRIAVGQTTVFELKVEDTPTGRPVTGRFVLAGGGAPAVSRRGGVSVSLERRGYSGRSLSSGMGRAGDDGRFKFDSVIPGEYFLTLSPTLGEPARYVLSKDQTEVRITVPPITPETAGKPLDIGEVEVVDTQK